MVEILKGMNSPFFCGKILSMLSPFVHLCMQPPLKTVRNLHPLIHSYHKFCLSLWNLVFLVPGKWHRLPTLTYILCELFPNPYFWTLTFPTAQCVAPHHTHPDNSQGVYRIGQWEETDVYLGSTVEYLRQTYHFFVCIVVRHKHTSYRSHASVCPLVPSVLPMVSTTSHIAVIRMTPNHRDNQQYCDLSHHNYLLE